MNNNLIKVGGKVITDILIFGNQEITPKGLVSLYNQGYSCDCIKLYPNSTEKVMVCYR